MSNSLVLAESGFEVVTFGGITAGEIKAEVFEDPDRDPVQVIREDQDVVVKVTWSIEGELVKHLCGAWCLAVALESVGPDTEPRFPAEYPIPFDQGTDYSAEIRIGAGELKANECGTVYKLAVTLTSRTPAGEAGHIAGYAVGGHVLVVPAAV